MTRMSQLPALGAYGASVVPATAGCDPCNAVRWHGGYGTALGVIRGAVEQGKSGSDCR